MELFASEAARMEFEFEKGSDPWEEYRAVLRAEAFDPYENEPWDEWNAEEAPITLEAPVEVAPEDEPPF